MKKITLSFLMVLALMHSASALDIIRDGKICIAPVTGENAAAPERFAFDEFSRILQKMANQALPDKSDTVSRLVIGTPSTNSGIAEKSDFLGLNRDDLKKRDSFVIRTVGNDIYAASNTPSGAMFAVFELLERLGVRWFFPSEDGEFIPVLRNRTLSTDEMNIVSVPDFEFRTLSAHYQRDKYIFLQHIKTTASSPDPKKYGTNGFYSAWGGHSFNWFFPPDCKTIDEYFKKYPEQFALDKKSGKRVISQHCYSNPDTKRTFLNWIDVFWTKNPDCEMLSLVPRDSPVSCQCEECLKLDSSTLTHKFIAELIRESEKKHPGRMHKTIAYSFYTPPPQCELPQNQRFNYCMTDCCYKHKIDDPACTRNPKHIEGLAAWKKKLSHTGSYGYEFIAFGTSPVYTPLAPVIASHIRCYRKMELSWFQTENFQRFDPAQPWEFHACFINRYPIYAAMRLAWDSSLDTDSILKDFCQYSYGDASAEMEKYHKLMEDAWQKSDRHLCGYNGNYKNHAEGFITSELIEKVDGLFAAALKKTENSPRENKAISADRTAWTLWRDIGRRYIELHAKLDSGSGDVGELRTRLAGDAIYKPDFSQLFKDFEPSGKNTDVIPDDSRPPVLTKHPDFAEGCMAGRGYENGKAYDFISMRPKERKFLFADTDSLFHDFFERCNYEISMQFRFPEDSKGNLWIETSLRHGGLRLGQRFSENVVTIGFRSVNVSTKIRAKDPSLKPLPDELNVKIPKLEKGRWYPVRIRAVDQWIFIDLDGKEVAVYGPVFGGGCVSFYSPAADIKDLVIREIK